MCLLINSHHGYRCTVKSVSVASAGLVPGISSNSTAHCAVQSRVLCSGPEDEPGEG